MREIAKATGLASTSSVSYQLSKLEEQGLVVREPGRPRTVMVRGRQGRAVQQFDEQGPDQAGGEALAQVPLVGRIAAGSPIMAAELAEDIVPCQGCSWDTGSSLCSAWSATP